jgi:hypothetical protein
MRCVALLSIACLLSSCATISHGRDEVTSVESDPSGANATIRCAGNVSVAGATPARLTIPRKADGCSVYVDMRGMQPKKVVLERGFTAAYWANLVPTLGFPIYIYSRSIFATGSGGAGWLAFALAGAAGLVVDRATGAMYDHDPKVIKVTLQPEH